MEDWEFLNMQIRKSITNFGFTMLEMSITIMIIGIITVGGINFQISMMDNSHRNITLDKLNRIERAINEYFLENGQLPCPGNITLSSTSSSYGVEYRNSSGDCYVASSSYLNNNIIYGSVPTKTLGLTSDYGVDAWKSSIAYVIYKDYGKKSTFLSSGGEAITVKNLNDDTITNKAIYFLFSPGSNKNGAFRNGVKNSINTSLDDNVNAYKSGFTKYFIKDVISDGFDDVGICKEKNDIVLEDDLENLDNNWSYSSNINCPDKICQHNTEIVSSSTCSSGYISKIQTQILLIIRIDQLEDV